MLIDLGLDLPVLLLRRGQLFGRERGSTSSLDSARDRLPTRERVLGEQRFDLDLQLAAAGLFQVREFGLKARHLHFERGLLIAQLFEFQPLPLQFLV